MIYLIELNADYLNNNRTVAAIGYLKATKGGGITVEVRGFCDECNDFIQLAPTAIKSIIDAEIMIDITNLPSGVGVGDRVSFNLGGSNNTYHVTNIKAAPVERITTTVATELTDNGYCKIAFVYMGKEPSNNDDTISVESICFSDAEIWHEIGEGDSYLQICRDGVSCGDVDLAVNQRYTGLLTDEGGVAISDILTIANREPGEREQDDTDPNENALIAQILAYKRIATLTGVDVSVVAIAANTQSIRSSNC